MIFGVCTASPRPMLSVTFIRRGTSSWLPNENCFISCGTTSLRYLSCRRGMVSPMAGSSSASNGRAGLRDANLVAVLVLAGADAGRLVGLAVDRHHVARVDRQLLLGDAALRHLLRRLLVAL